MEANLPEHSHSFSGIPGTRIIARLSLQSGIPPLLQFQYLPPISVCITELRWTSTQLKAAKLPLISAKIWQIDHMQRGLLVHSEQA